MRFALTLLAGLVFLGNAQAQARIYDQAELDTMLAPIALQPDGVVSQVLIASTYPDEVAAAARWSRANPHMRGEGAVRAVQNEPWDPAVKALVAFPELLIRMDDSPQWLNDLGQAFVQQQAQVMDTVQALRRRAQAAGHLPSTDQYSVYQQGEAIVVEPRTQIVYVRYYDPYVVYGPWWWPHYYPVFWHPWVVRPVFIGHSFWYAKPHWHGRHVHVVHRPVHVPSHHHHNVVPGKWQPSVHKVVRQVSVQPHVRVPESQRRPIVQSAPAARETLQHSPIRQQRQMPAANGFTQQREHRGQAQQQPRGREHRAAPTWQQWGEAQGRGFSQRGRGHGGQQFHGHGQGARQFQSRGRS